MLKSLARFDLGFCDGPHVRGYARSFIRGGGRQGVCLIYVACSLAVHGGGTLCLLAGMEQVEFVSKVRAKHEQFPALAPAYVAKCHSFSIGKPLAYLLKGRMAEKDVDKLDANKTQTERKQFPAHGSRRCKARFWLR